MLKGIRLTGLRSVITRIRRVGLVLMAGAAINVAFVDF